VVSAQTYKITVNITGLHSNNGKVFVELFNNEDGYPTKHEKAYRSTIRTITNGACTVAFDSLIAGDYAVACYHDENDNGKLDVNFLGIPSEGVGASNNAKGFLGPPSFKNAKFPVNGDVVQNIVMNY
jgi:uncharacterized protein (DUF2141 family)